MYFNGILVYGEYTSFCSNEYDGSVTIQPCGGVPSAANKLWGQGFGEKGKGLFYLKAKIIGRIMGFYLKVYFL